MKQATTALLLIALTIGATTAQAQSTKDIKKIAEKGHPEAQYTLGVLYQHGDGDLVPEDPEQAIHWYKKAAEQGHRQAQFVLGFDIAKGDGAIQDFKQAVHWWQKAAEQGHPDAQYFLGTFYGGGLGVPEDKEQALTWFILSKASEEQEELTETIEEAITDLRKELTPAQISKAEERATELHEEIEARKTTPAPAN